MRILSDAHTLVSERDYETEDFYASSHGQYRKLGESALASAHTLHVHSAKNGPSINVFNGVAFGSTNLGLVMKIESVVNRQNYKNTPRTISGKIDASINALAAGCENLGFVTEGESAGFRPEHTHAQLTVLRG